MGDGEDEGGNVTFFREESNKEPVCDVESLVELNWEAALPPHPPPWQVKTSCCLDLEQASPKSALHFSPWSGFASPRRLQSACHGAQNGSAAFQVCELDSLRHNAAFFDSFLVRPTLLPYSKRGFQAAIYKIARPQPPAAALWLQEESYPRPLRPPPPHEKAPSPSAGGGAIFKPKSSFIRPAQRCPGFPGAHRSADRPKPRRSTARCSSHRSGAGRHS